MIRRVDNFSSYPSFLQAFGGWWKKGSSSEPEINYQAESSQSRKKMVTMWDDDECN